MASLYTESGISLSEAMAFSASTLAKSAVYSNEPVCTIILSIVG